MAARRLAWGVSGVACASIGVRQWRRVQQLPEGYDRPVSAAELQWLCEAADRISLMRSYSGVSGELDTIERWHHDRGYRGAAVLRDLRHGEYRNAIRPGGRTRRGQQLGTPPAEAAKARGDEAASSPPPPNEKTLGNRECYYMWCVARTTLCATFTRTRSSHGASIQTHQV